MKVIPTFAVIVALSLSLCTVSWAQLSGEHKRAVSRANSESFLESVNGYDMVTMSAARAGAGRWPADDWTRSVVVVEALEKDIGLLQNARLRERVAALEGKKASHAEWKRAMEDVRMAEDAYQCMANVQDLRVQAAQGSPRKNPDHALVAAAFVYLVRIRRAASLLGATSGGVRARALVRLGSARSAYDAWLEKRGARLASGPSADAKLLRHLAVVEYSTENAFGPHPPSEALGAIAFPAHS